MSSSFKGSFEISEDIIQNLLMLEVLLTQDSNGDDLFCGTLLPALNLDFSSAIIFLAWGLSLIKITFRMTLLE